MVSCHGHRRIERRRGSACAEGYNPNSNPNPNPDPDRNTVPKGGGWRSELHAVVDLNDQAMTLTLTLTLTLTGPD